MISTLKYDILQLQLKCYYIRVTLMFWLSPFDNLPILPFIDNFVLLRLALIFYPLYVWVHFSRSGIRNKSNMVSLNFRSFRQHLDKTVFDCDPFCTIDWACLCKKNTLTILHKIFRTNSRFLGMDIQEKIISMIIFQSIHHKNLKEVFY